MRLRKLSTVAVVALAVAAGLSACSTKVGQAASIGGYRVTDSQLATYVTRSGPTAAAASQAQSQGTAVQPKVQALTELIQEQLFTKTLAATGGVPSKAALAAFHDQAAQTFFNAQVGGAEFDSQLATQAAALGLSKKFTPLIIRASELEYALVSRVKATKIADLVLAVGKAHIPISVSGRYGTWDASQFTLSSTGAAGLPSFIKFAPTPGASSSAAPTPAG